MKFWAQPVQFQKLYILQKVITHERTTSLDNDLSP